MSDEEVLDAELVSDDKPVLLTEPAGPMTKLQALAVVLVLLLLSSTILYSMLSKEESVQQIIPEMQLEETSVFVTDSTGESIDVAPIDMTFFASSVGEDAAEPSIGITSTGCVFFIAFEK
ncbi:MAG: hypothetical protein CMB76_00385, partial [Euryarchaeota archaeon]|nr:hypothetical protein [Euryarchaeota archaeon]